MKAATKRIVTGTLAGIGCVVVIALLGSFIAQTAGENTTATITSMYGAASLVILLNIFTQVYKKDKE